MYVKNCGVNGEVFIFRENSISYRYFLVKNTFYSDQLRKVSVDESQSSLALRDLSKVIN